MLSERIMSAIIGILLLILFIFLGSIPFLFFILLIALLAIREYNRLIPISSKKNLYFLSLSILFFIIFTYLTNRRLIPWTYGFNITIFILIFFFYHILDREEGLLRSLGYNLFALLYIGGGLSYLLLLRDFNINPFINTKALWLVLLTTWATDTGAYFTGRFIGQRKLAPQISPNKTIEGAMGGLFLSVLVVVLFVINLGVYNYYWIIYAIMAALTGMVGDLFESAIKRDFGVKDSGTLIPGHGGILDRFDSLLFAAPFTYYFLLVFLS